MSEEKSFYKTSINWYMPTYGKLIFQTKEIIKWYKYLIKLVRDNIPNIIESNGEKAITRILGDEEYRVELYKKLLEESQEVINSQDTEDTLEELADVLEVLKSIAELENKNLDDIIEIANQKRLKRGGFSKKIFLEKTNM